MSFLNGLYHRTIADVAFIDLLTAIIYALLVLAVFVVLGLWWLFPAMIAVLVVGSLLRVWLKRRRSRLPL